MIHFPIMTYRYGQCAHIGTFFKRRCLCAAMHDSTLCYQHQKMHDSKTQKPYPIFLEDYDKTLTWENLLL